jgi:hypothetical protein
MARSSDPQKLALWQRRFQRFWNSGLAVARFCAREHVSVASFYHWRKKLGPKASRRRTSVRGDVFRPVTVVPAASVVSIQLRGGTRIEVCAEHLDAVRAVIVEVARVDRGPEAEQSPSPRCQTPHEESGVASC